MKKLSIVTGLALAIGMMSGTANAAPLSVPGSAPEATTLVEKTQSWRYRRDCVWVNGGWHYGRPGKYIVCRPHSPGRGWVWHSEGPRHGWYHPRHKRWHHNNW